MAADPRRWAAFGNAMFPLTITTAAPVTLFLSSVAAGIPAAADDSIDRKVDLSRHLVRNPTTTFLVRVTGDSMVGACINAGDLLVVDSSIAPRDGKIVIAVVDGDLTVKRLRIRDGAASLEPENPAFAPITIGSESDTPILGVVTSVIHDL